MFNDSFPHLLPEHSRPDQGQECTQEGYLGAEPGKGSPKEQKEKLNPSLIPCFPQHFLQAELSKAWCGHRPSLQERHSSGQTAEGDKKGS